MRIDKLIYVAICLFAFVDVSAQIHIEWANTTNCKYDGSTKKLSCVDAEKWSKSGAFSNNVLVQNKEGNLSFPVHDRNFGRAIGFSSSDKDLNWNSIEYCFLIDFNQELFIYESGTLVLRAGRLKVGDRLSLSRKLDGSIFYLKNSITIHKSRKPYLGRLSVDCAFEKKGAFFTNVMTSFDVPIVSDPSVSGKFTIDKHGSGDFISFEQMFNYLNKKQLIDGGVVVTVNSGTYNEVINFGDFQMSQKAGSKLSILGMENVKFKNNGPISFSDLNNISIKNMEIQFTNSLKGGLIFDNCDNLVLSGLNIKTAVTNAVVNYTALKISTSDKSSIDNCLFTNFVKNIETSNSNDIGVKNCGGAVDATYGMRFTQSSNISILNCKIYSKINSVELVAPSGDSFINGNLITSAGKDAIQVTESVDALTISQNEIDAPSGNAIKIYSFADNLKISGNKIVANGIGIKIKDPTFRNTDDLDNVKEKNLIIDSNELICSTGIEIYKLRNSDVKAWNNRIDSDNGFNISEGVFDDDYLLEIGGNVVSANNSSYNSEDSFEKSSILLNTFINGASSNSPVLKYVMDNSSICGNIFASYGNGSVDEVLPPYSYNIWQQNSYWSSGSNGSQNLSQGGCTDCIFSDPKFIDPINKDYRLRHDSPLLNKEITCASSEDYMDLNGSIRSGMKDYGAIEMNYGEWDGVRAEVILRDGIVLTPNETDFKTMVINGLDNYSSYSIKIFDKLNNLVYSTAIDNTWDGNSSITNELVPVGLYNYTLELDTDKRLNGLVYVSY